MAVRSVAAPDGRVWLVRRRWTRRRPRWRGWRQADRKERAWRDWLPDFLDFGLADDAIGPVLGIVLAVVVVVVTIALAVLFVVPALLALVDIVILVLGALVGMLARTLLGRPWEIDAETGGPPAEHRTWRVRGLAASKRAVNDVVLRLQAGVEAHPIDAEPASG